MTSTSLHDQSHDGSATAGGAGPSFADGGSPQFGPLNDAIVRLSRAHRALAAQLMREVGLRPEQAALMMHLWAVGPIRQTALAVQFGKDSASTTRTVQRLEHAGFLRRRADPADGRATLVEPTPAGNALRSRIEGMWTRLEEVVRKPLSEEESRIALPLLRTLGDAVTAALATQSTRAWEEL